MIGCEECWSGGEDERGGWGEEGSFVVGEQRLESERLVRFLSLQLREGLAAWWIARK